VSNLRKAAEQALTALEAMQSYAAVERKGLRICDEAIPALRAALAEPEPEPVAWMVYTLDSKSVCVTDNPADFTGHHRALPLYTAPPAAALAEPEQKPEPPAKPEPATREQAGAAYDGKKGTHRWVDFRDGWQAAERFHGIKKEDKT